MPTDKDLSKYRIEQAEECLKVSKQCATMDAHKSAANRSYYCVFNSMRGVLALDKVDFKKHSAVMSYFRANYIKTGILGNDLSDILKDLFEVRNASDYDPFYVVSKEEVEQQIEEAEYFLDEVKKYLSDKIG